MWNTLSLSKEDLMSPTIALVRACDLTAMHLTPTPETGFSKLRTKHLVWNSSNLKNNSFSFSSCTCSWVFKKLTSLTSSFGRWDMSDPSRWQGSSVGTRPLKYLGFQDSKKATKWLSSKSQNLIHCHSVTFIQNHLEKNTKHTVFLRLINVTNQYPYEF